jgi:hypothetical protein
MFLKKRLNLHLEVEGLSFGHTILMSTFKLTPCL